MDFDCEAYGPDLPRMCYFEDRFLVCGDAAMCHARMGLERFRVWQRLQELANTDPLWREVAAELSGPEELFSAPDSPHAPGRVVDPVDNPSGPLRPEGR